MSADVMHVATRAARAQKPPPRDAFGCEIFPGYTSLRNDAPTPQPMQISTRASPLAIKPSPSLTLHVLPNINTAAASAGTEDPVRAVCMI